MKIQIIETAKNTNLRLTETNEYKIKQLNSTANIYIDHTKEYQEIIGFGGAITEAAAFTLSKMSVDKRNEVLEKYYHKEKGLNYSLGRMHINSCDFALGNYTYVKENDKTLESFDILREKKWVVPFVKEAIKVRGENIAFLASPWSPPAWMKTNKEMNNGGKLLPEYFSTWAKYYVKYINAMKEEGIEIWGITVQNEPAAVQTWDSCIYTAEEERDFVKNYLGPTMYKEKLKNIKILIWDHNRDVLPERAKLVLEDCEAAKYVWGTGVHWYESEEFDNLNTVHNMFPDKNILFTEGCQEGGVHLGAWDTGERYARNIIGDFNNWCVGFLDWNIVLDENGGPNHVNNLCDSPIIADTKNNEIIYNSSYFYIGHFSKYIKPGAKRLGINIENTTLICSSFKNTDNSICIIILNQNDFKENTVIKIKEQTIEVSLKKHSIMTIVIN